MNCLSKTLFFLALVTLAFGQENSECAQALKEFESSEEGQLIGSCLEKAQNSDTSICGGSECSKLSLPSSLDDVCSEPQDKVLLETLKIYFEEYNQILPQVCSGNLDLNTAVENAVNNVSENNANIPANNPLNSNDNAAPNPSASAPLNNNAANPSASGANAPVSGTNAPVSGANNPANNTTTDGKIITSSGEKLTYSLLALLVVTFNFLL